MEQQWTETDFEAENNGGFVGAATSKAQLATDNNCDVYIYYIYDNMDGKYPIEARTTTNRL